MMEYEVAIQCKDDTVYFLFYNDLKDAGNYPDKPQNHPHQQGRPARILKINSRMLSVFLI
jgi:hypothetical protein